MRIKISPSAITGSVDANPSKSHAQRAIAIAALTNGSSTLAATGLSADVLAALDIAEAMGARVERRDTAVVITGAMRLRSPQWHCRESGLCLRMFAAIAPLFSEPITLSGEGTLPGRPLDFVQDTLRQMGVTVHTNHGKLPFTITGPYLRTSIDLDGSLSSQFLTGLLIALPAHEQDSQLTVRNLVSRPYIDLTISALGQFGVTVSHHNHEVFEIPGRQTYRHASLRIAGDWSGMANLLVAGAIAGDITVRGLEYPDVQADNVILDLLKDCDAHVSMPDGAIRVKKGPIRCFDFDAKHCPDLIPALCVLALHAKDTSRITGIRRLYTKESNRAMALVSEFAKLGVHVGIEDDTFMITGQQVRGGEVHAHRDHRIAMALAVAALTAQSPVIIDGAECIRKSYPGFFRHLRLLGADVQEENTTR